MRMNKSGSLLRVFLVVFTILVVILGISVGWLYFSLHKTNPEKLEFFENNPGMIYFSFGIIAFIVLISLIVLFFRKHQRPEVPNIAVS